MKIPDHVRELLMEVLTANNMDDHGMTLEEARHHAGVTLDILERNTPTEEMFRQILEDELERHMGADGYSDREAAEAATAKRVDELITLSRELGLAIEGEEE